VDAVVDLSQRDGFSVTTSMPRPTSLMKLAVNRLTAERSGVS
jgi:hypothetical protein